MATNLIDADHLINYALDDGTANSFLLHGLHKYWYALLSAPLLVGLMFRATRCYAVAIFLGLALHYLLDLLSVGADYSIVWLISGDLVLYIALLLSFERRMRNILLFSAMLLIPTLAIGFELYVLKIPVQSSPVYHITTLVLNLAAIVSVVMINKSALSKPL